MTVPYTRKLRQGTTEIFWWRSPSPVDPLNVDVTFRLTAGDHGPVAMTPLFDDVVVTAVAADRRTLTIAAPPAIRSGPEGILGDAWLLTGSDGALGVRIVQIGATTATLGEPLPSSVDVSASGTLRAAWYAVPVAAANVTAAVERNVPTRVRYSITAGDDVTDLGLADEVLVHVVRQPFGTGLSPSQVGTLVASLAPRVAQRQQDYRPTVQASLEELEEWTREAAGARSITEDDLDGSRLHGAHSALCVSYVFEDIDPALADRWRLRARERFDMVLRSIWMDLDGDGVVDAGEIGAVIQRANDCGGNMPTPDDDRIIGTADGLH